MINGLTSIFYCIFWAIVLMGIIGGNIEFGLICFFLGILRLLAKVVTAIEAVAIVNALSLDSQEVAP